MNFLILASSLVSQKILISTYVGGKSHLKHLLEISQHLLERKVKIHYIGFEKMAQFASNYNVTTENYLESLPSSEHDRLYHLLSRTNEKEELNTLFDIISYKYVENFEDFERKVLTYNPDLLICDFFATLCIDLANQHNIPFIVSFQTIDIPNFPNPPYISSGLKYQELTIKDYSFLKRMRHTLIDPLIGYHLLNPINDKMNLKRNKVGMDSVNNFLGNWTFALKISNSFFPFHQPREFPPSIQLIGPILSFPKTELSEEYKEFLNQYDQTMYMGMGSNALLKRHEIEKMLKVAILALNRGVVNGVIWSRGRTPIQAFPDQIQLENDHYNVTELISGKLIKGFKLVDWVPQLSLLHHPNLVLFWSHGGLESCLEAIQSKTKIVVSPFFADQPRNAKSLEELKIGQYININDKEVSILSKITELLNSDVNWNWIHLFVKFSERRRAEAANLIEEFLYKAIECRKIDPNSRCEMNGLLTVKEEMGTIKSYSLDVWVSFIALFTLTIVLFLTWLGSFSRIINKTELKIKTS